MCGCRGLSYVVVPTLGKCLLMRRMQWCHASVVRGTGNHQTYALDIGFVVDGLLREAGIMPRGLVSSSACETRDGS